MSVNKTILIGRVGQNAEIKTFDNGNKVASFSLATSEKWKDKSGDVKESTCWHNIKMYGDKAELAEKYIKKGMQLYLEGKIHYGNYEDKEGNKKYFTEINCFQVQFLSRMDTNSESQAESVPDSEEDSQLPF